MDPVFDLVAAHLDLPTGWGFPAVSPAGNETARAKSLREALYPMRGDEGVAQLVRWHYGVVRSYPAVAMGVGHGEETYDPGLAWRPPIAALTNEVKLTASPDVGVLEMLWEPAGEISVLQGEINVDGAALSLSLDGTTYPLSYTITESLECAVTWPAFLRTKAAFSAMPTQSFTIQFRPRRFNADFILSRVEPLIGNADLAEIGAGDLWRAQESEQRIALVWAVMQNLRHGR